jgi:hydroxyacylglutathione hydrolase
MNNLLKILWLVGLFYSRMSAKNYNIIQVPVLSDNYSYLLCDTKTGEAFAVDPAEPAKVISAAESNGVKLKGVLTTHHHWDHAGGNKEISSKLGLEVIGGDKRIEALTREVKHGDKISLGDHVTITCLFTPCHTSGHMLYYVEDTVNTSNTAVFTGDTLFVAGCGRFFEGTAQQMHEALLGVIASLPLTTEVYCGHEYTVKNLQFALTLEPNNQHIKDKLSWAEEQRRQQKSTVPSTIGQELQYNPFMRVNSSELRAHLKMPDATNVEVMGKVRELKDKF